MARRVAHRGGIIQAPQRQIANDGFQGEINLAFGSSTTGTALGGTAFAIVVAAATLVRTRGIFAAKMLVNGATNNIAVVTMGLIIVSAEAFSAGLASVSTPLDDIERAWFVW